MTILQLALVAAGALALSSAPAVTLAATPPAAPTAKKPAPAPARGKKAVKPVEPPPPPPPEADEAQLAAAEKVYYGVYECEFKLSVDIVASPKFKGYVDVKHLKSAWLMKPVLSSTGAIRLEDVHNETLMVQISSKSMLLNVKTGHRIVDECVSAGQRALIEAARAKAAEAASAAAAASAAPSAAAPVAEPKAPVAASGPSATPLTAPATK